MSEQTQELSKSDLPAGLPELGFKAEGDPKKFGIGYRFRLEGVTITGFAGRSAEDATQADMQKSVTGLAGFFINHYRSTPKDFKLEKLEAERLYSGFERVLASEQAKLRLDLVFFGQGSGNKGITFDFYSDGTALKVGSTLATMDGAQLLPSETRFLRRAEGESGYLTYALGLHRTGKELSWTLDCVDYGPASPRETGMWWGTRLPK